MPIGLPVAMLISSAIGGGTAAIGSALNKSAQGDALSSQTDYNNRALQAQIEQQSYERQQNALELANEQSEFSKQFGLSQQQFGLTQSQFNNTIDRQNYQRGAFNQYLGRLQPFSDAGKSALPTLQNLVRPSAVGFGGGAQNGNGVLLRAPDGSTAMVDPAHVDHFTSLGATPVSSNG